MIGAVLAVLSLFLPWMVAQDQRNGGRLYFGAFDFGGPGPNGYAFSDSFGYSAALFMIGAILAFVTPFGGIPSLIGNVGFALALTSTTFRNFSTSVWVGWMVAFVAAGIVMIGLIWPVGPGYAPEGEEGLFARLLTWSLYG